MGEDRFLQNYNFFEINQELHRRVLLLNLLAPFLQNIFRHFLMIEWSGMPYVIVPQCQDAFYHNVMSHVTLLKKQDIVTINV